MKTMAEKWGQKNKKKEIYFFAPIFLPSIDHFLQTESKNISSSS
jgi:hypothetical protein